jgi:hypothetical protein
MRPKTHPPLIATISPLAIGLVGEEAAAVDEGVSRRPREAVDAT